MDIVITKWALNSYLELKHDAVFSSSEYKTTIRPNVLLLKNYPTPTEFQNSKFWGPATDHAGNIIQKGYKMKWHHVGPGRVQLRAPIGMFEEAYLCQAYVKSDPKKEKRELAKFKVHLELIKEDRFTECGRLK